MGILSRFSSIMSANFNAILDKMEDPSKMVDQYIREIEDDLGKVKAETAAVMAEEQRAKRELDECNSDIEKMSGYAQKAVAAGNDDDARTFLSKKASYQKQQTEYLAIYNQAHDNAEKMRQMYNKLQSQLDELSSRRQAIKSKMSMAKTQEKMNKVTGSVDSVKGGMSAFERMEQKANRVMDEANAMAELSRGPESGIEDMMKKYDNPETSGTSEIDDELRKLKEQYGKQ